MIAAASVASAQDPLIVSMAGLSLNNTFHLHKQRYLSYLIAVKLDPAPVVLHFIFSHQRFMCLCPAGTTVRWQESICLTI